MTKEPDVIQRKIILEKVDQAIGILREKDVDMWLTFVRETSQLNDPSMSLIVSPDLQMTWHSAFILTKPGERIAIVGRYDKENIQLTGAYPEVIGYDQSIRQAVGRRAEAARSRLHRHQLQ